MAESPSPMENNVALENQQARIDVRPRLLGAAKYTADIQIEGMLHGRLVRSPFGLAKVKTADIEAAKAIPGVVSVEVDTTKQAKYTGAVVGRIVAESRAALDDAMAALKLTFARETPKAYVTAEDTALPDIDNVKQTAIQELLSAAHAVVEATYTTQIQTHSCLEPHGGVVHFKGDSAEAWGSTQGTFAYHEGIVKQLDLPEDKVVVRNEYVGGGFGSKFGPGAEGNLAAQASKANKRPCRVMLDRKEEHLDGGCRPGSVQHMKIGADKDGKLLGGRIHLVNLVGHSQGGGGIRNPMHYRFGKIEKTEGEVSFNAQQPRAFRAPGWPVGCFAVEMMMDELATKLGIDPLEMRLLNEESDRRRGMLKRGAPLIGWERRQASGTWPGRFKHGFGIGAASWGVWPTPCQCDIDIHRSGRVDIRAGVQDIGTGTNTLVVDYVANHLGLKRSQLSVRLGDSRNPPGPGSGGSVVSRSVTSALNDALKKVDAELVAIAAAEWKVAESEVSIGSGIAAEIGGRRTLNFAQACQRLRTEKISLRGETRQGQDGSGTSDGVQFAEVVVDTHTGIVRVERIVAVHAAGRIVNRKTFENQVCGGVIQGIGYALMEDRRLDPVTGGMVNADFINYKIPGTKDIPDIIPVVDWVEGDEGVKPIGEPSTIPTAGAIGCAVANAIGAPVRSLPLTPDRVLAALDARAQGGTSA